jgi:hypothetical protein
MDRQRIEHGPGPELKVLFGPSIGDLRPIPDPALFSDALLEKDFDLGCWESTA